VRVEPGEAAGLAAAVYTVVSQPSRLAKLGRLARDRAASNFTWAAAARAAMQAYERILKEQHSPRPAAPVALKAGWASK
jgi:glycosyltransferase involved in cell wall biosynthesis